jgi:hypothetical protein
MPLTSHRWLCPGPSAVVRHKEGLRGDSRHGIIHSEVMSWEISTRQNPDTPEGLKQRLFVRIHRIPVELPHSSKLEQAGQPLGPLVSVLCTLSPCVTYIPGVTLILVEFHISL